MLESSRTIIVIDAGVAIYTVTDTPLSEGAAIAWAQWQKDRAEIHVPALWRCEVTSVLHKLFQLKQLTETEAEAALEAALDLDAQTAEIDVDLCRDSFRWATRLKTHAAYDTFYLALAERLGAVFWTGDRRLASNAQSLGAVWVRWIGEQETLYRSPRAT